MELKFNKYPLYNSDWLKLSANSNKVQFPWDFKLNLLKPLIYNLLPQIFPDNSNFK